MSMKIARWCVIYGLGGSIAMAIINIISGPVFDWNFVVFSLMLSGIVYCYLEYYVEPQLKKKEAELNTAKAAEQQTPKRGRRPKLKKK